MIEPPDTAEIVWTYFMIPSSSSRRITPRWKIEARNPPPERARPIRLGFEVTVFFEVSFMLIPSSLQKLDPKASQSRVPTVNPRLHPSASGAWREPACQGSTQVLSNC